MTKVLSASAAGLGFPLIPPDGGQAPVRGSNQDPAQQPAPSPQEPRASEDVATPAVSQRPVEPGSEGQKQSRANEKDGGRRGAKSREAFQPDLSAQEQAVVRRLQARDREVRAHEQAHVAAGGPHAGGASYSYQTGPDGRQYAVAGEVPIDASEASTPEATLQKARIVRRAALAPAQPSAADRQVAAKARAMEQEAQGDIQEEKQEQAQLAAQDREIKEEAGGASLPLPPRLPKAPPFSVRMNPLSKTV